LSFRYPLFQEGIFYFHFLKTSINKNREDIILWLVLSELTTYLFSTASRVTMKDNAATLLMT